MKLYLKIALAMLVIGFFWWGFSTPVQATPLGGAPNSGRAVLPPPNNPYFTVQTTTLQDGTKLDGYIINGPPVSPRYVIQNAAAPLPQPNRELGALTLPVPAFRWIYGCSAVSAAMIAAFYDQTGYPNMYTGATNGGVMPSPTDDSTWPLWNDGSGDDPYPQNPLIASHQGLDSRSTRGSLDDYWVAYESSAQDPFITHSWSEHTWGDAVGDFMKTSQSNYGNPDGSTEFYNYTSSSSRLTCDAMVSGGISDVDGTYGRKLFYEAKGYTVTDCYNQKTDNNGGGFTFTNFKAEIDAGHPVLLNLNGHSIVGMGYDTSSNTVYLHDTWDYSMHSMTWGGYYPPTKIYGYPDPMELLSVSIVNLAPSSSPVFYKISPANAGATLQPTNPTLTWSSSGGATEYKYCYDATDDSTCDGTWTSAGANTSVSLSGLSSNTTYYWQVQSWNGSSGPTYADGASTAYWSFTTEAANNPPYAPSNPSPANGVTGVGSTPTMSWTGGDPDGDAVTYDVYMQANAYPSTKVSSHQSATVFAPGSLLPGTVYYWQVVAKDSRAATTTGPVWSFQTQPGAGPFSLSAPQNGAANQPTELTLTWQAATPVTRYEVCYDTTNDNACSAWLNVGTNTSLPITALANSSTVFWLVRAWDNAIGPTYANNGTWWAFTVQPEGYRVLLNPIYIPFLTRSR